MKCGIVIHGGAGSKIIGKQRLESLESELTGIASKSLSKLDAGASSLQAVRLAVNMMESSKSFNAGMGSVKTSDGTVEMDAGIMDGHTMKCGGVGAVSGFVHPVDMAGKIMNIRHSLLVGKQAEKFALKKGLVRTKITGRLGSEKSDTVGAVAIDGKGNLACAVSTGGISGKTPGRVGDSAVVGAGFYADKNAAAVTTGNGDVILKTGMSIRACLMSASGAPNTVAKKMLGELGTHDGGFGGIIMIDKKGRYYSGHNTAVMTSVSVFSGDSPRFSF